MFLLFKNQIKKIKNNLLYFLSISLILLIVSITFTAFKSSVFRLEENYDEYLEQQSIDDYYMLMGNVDVNYLGGTSLLELCNTYELQDECANLVFFPDDEELKNNLNYLLNEAITNNPDPYEAILDGYITQFESRYKVDVEKVITLNVMDDDYIYKFRTMTYSIDIPYIIDGRAPILLNEIALYPEFLEHNDLKLLDEITIEDITYTIVGTFYAPEYMMPIFSSNRVEYDEKIQSLVLMTKETINQNNVPLIVKYNVKGDLSEIFNEFDYEQLFSADFSKLGKEMQLLDIIVPQELNFRVTALKDEVRMANLFIDLFLGVFIVLSGILLVVFMRKYIEKNKRDIKILNSMGYNEKEITLSLLAFPFFVSLMSLLGYVIGLLLSSTLFEIYGSRYYYTKAGFKIVSLKLTQLTVADAQAFYAVHSARPFYGELVEFMSSGPIVAAILEKENAVADFRALIGSTDPAEAAEGTIRKAYAESKGRNAVHGSDSDENAEIEGKFHFSAEEIH